VRILCSRACHPVSRPAPSNSKHTRRYIDTGMHRANR
jgi:hypothetical protein